MLGTSYDVWVLDTCALGSVSNWVGPVTFTTDTLPNVTASSMLVSVTTVATFDFNASGAALIYGWDFGDGIQDSGMAVTHDYTVNGTYTVVLSSYNDCGVSYDTITVTVTGIGLDKYGLSDFKLYPNPNNGKFVVENIANTGGDVTIEVVNLTGVILYTNVIKPGTNGSHEIDLRGYAPGMYQVRVSNSAGTGVKPFVLRN